MLRVRREYFKSLKHLLKMTFDEKRTLLQLIFAEKGPDGHRPGVYLKKVLNGWIYTIRGGIINTVIPIPKGAVPRKENLLEWATAVGGYSEDDDISELKQFLYESNQKSMGI